MTTKAKHKGPSLEPQIVKSKYGRAWYYEFPGSIHVIVPNDAPKLGDGGSRRVRIPKRMLLKSLERMGR